MLLCKESLHAVVFHEAGGKETIADITVHNNVSERKETERPLQKTE